MQETQTHPTGITVSVPLITAQSPDKWEGWIRKGIRFKICAKSNMQIRCGDPLGNKGVAEST